MHGLHASMSMLEGIGWEQVFARNRALADRAVAGLSAHGLRFLSPLDVGRRSNIVNAVPNDLERTLAALKQARIAVSTPAISVSRRRGMVPDTSRPIISDILGCARM